MAGRDPVGAIRRRYDYGSRNEDGPEFIRCVGGLESQIHKILTFGEDGVTRKVYPTAQVDIGDGFVAKFTTNYLTSSWLRIPMFGVNSVNGSVQWLGVPPPLRNDAPPWVGNILAPSPSWGTGGTATNPNWGS